MCPSSCESRARSGTGRTRVCSRLPEAYATLRPLAAANTWRSASSLQLERRRIDVSCMLATGTPFSKKWIILVIPLNDAGLYASIRRGPTDPARTIRMVGICKDNSMSTSLSRPEHIPRYFHLRYDTRSGSPHINALLQPLTQHFLSFFFPEQVDAPSGDKNVVNVIVTSDPNESTLNNSITSKQEIHINFAACHAFAALPSTTALLNRLLSTQRLAIDDLTSLDA